MYTHEDDDHFETEKNEFGHVPRVVMPRPEDGFFGLRPFSLSSEAQKTFPSAMNHGDYLDVTKVKPAKRDIQPL